MYKICLFSSHPWPNTLQKLLCQMFLGSEVLFPSNLWVHDPLQNSNPHSSAAHLLHLKKFIFDWGFLLLVLTHLRVCQTQNFPNGAAWCGFSQLLDETHSCFSETCYMLQLWRWKHRYWLERVQISRFSNVPPACLVEHKSSRLLPDRSFVNPVNKGK